MDVNFILGMIGNIGFFYGAIAFANKHISAWYAQIIANLFYVVQAILMHNMSLLMLSIILIFVNIYGIYSWNKKPKKKEDVHVECYHRHLIESMNFYDGEE